MNHKFVLTGYENDKGKSELVVSADNKNFTFQITQYFPKSETEEESCAEVIIKEPSYLVCKDLKEYLQKYTVGVSYKERDYFKYFNPNMTVCQENLIRTFAVSSSFLDFFVTNPTDMNDPNSVKLTSAVNQINDWLYDQLLIDWTGGMDVQPQMYFLSKSLYKKEVQGEKISPALEELYKLGLLQKYNCESPYKFENYYVPFVLPNVDYVFKQFSNYKTKNLWKEIVQGVNKEVRRLVNNYS